MKESEPFVRVMINCTGSAKEHKALMKRYAVKGFPAVVFLDPNGQEVERFCGNCDASEFLNLFRTLTERYHPARRLRKSVDDLAELRKWIEERIDRLGHDDPEVRGEAIADLERLKLVLESALQIAVRSEDPEVRVRAGHLQGRKGPAPIVVPVRAHSVVEQDNFKVEFDCAGEGVVSFTLSGADAERLELVNPRGAVIETTTRGGKLPQGFGMASELRIYPRP